MEEIYKQCRTCMGNGIENTFDASGNPIQVSCTACNGTGKYLCSTMDLSNITNKLNDILDKCDDILEAING